MILTFPEFEQQGKQLAAVLGCEHLPVDIHHFPDGESKVTLPPQLPPDLILCRSLDHPNDKLIELMLTCLTARNQGVAQITLVAPYLCYMRQDIAFHPGEVVSQKLIGHWLGTLVDRVITVDPHLHRIDHLGQAIPNAEAISLTAAQPMAAFLKQHAPKAVLLGPDEESEQWVSQIAGMAGLDWAIATKNRSGDRDVEITLPDFIWRDRQVVIIDDVASTGHTAAQAARLALDGGARSVDCLVTHALFADDALEIMNDAGIRHIWSSDTIPHHSNVISLAELLAGACHKL